MGWVGEVPRVGDWHPEGVQGEEGQLVQAGEGGIAAEIGACEVNHRAEWQ